jgi:hypothetical protein
MEAVLNEQVENDKQKLIDYLKKNSIWLLSSLFI